MGQVIAVVSGKGGTGKTSFVAHVGLSLAAMGNRVLCLDCDMGLRNLDLALGMSDRAVMDFTDVLSGRCTLREAATPHPVQKNLFLVTAPSRPCRFIDEAAFGAMIREIRQSYDYCLIDAPAGLETGFRIAVCACDRAVVISTTDATSLRDAQRTVMELGHLPRGKVHMVVNRCKKKLLKSLHQTIDDAMDSAGLPLLGVIPEDDDVPLSLGRGIPLNFMYNRCAAVAYRNIAQRIAGQKIRLMKIR